MGVVSIYLMNGVDIEPSLGFLTASMGLSFANLAIFAKSSFRFSGGKMLSMNAWTLLPMPPNVPWRVPVRPVTTSAIFGEAVVVCCSSGSQTSCMR